MADALVPALAVLLWIAVIYKLSNLRRDPRNLVLRALCLSFIAFAISVTVFLPPVYLSLDHVIGIPNIAEPVGRGLVLLGGLAAQSMLLFLAYPGPVAARKIWKRWFILVAGIVAMAVFFALAPVDHETQRFTSAYASAPFVTEYWLVFLAYLGFALVDIVHLCLRYARLADRELLGVGLRFVAAGCSVGLAYVAYKAFYLTARELGATLSSELESVVSRALAVGAFVLILIGTTLPAWGRRLRLSSARRWVRHYRAYRRLHPLWLALCQSTPEIALVPPPSGIVEGLVPRDLGFQLYRRVIEIRDGILALRPYMDADLRNAALAAGHEAGLRGDDLEVVMEAATLAAALPAKAQGRRAARQSNLKVRGEPDFEGELAWLTKLANAYAQSPVVRIAAAAPLERVGHKAQAE